MPRLRAAVIGVGHMGLFHAQKYAVLDDVDLVAVVDIEPLRARRVAEALGVRAVTSYRQILGQIDIASIAVPARDHLHVARDLLDAGVHVLLEKPIAVTADEATELVGIAAQRELVLQIGHLERFNPVVVAAHARMRAAEYVQARRTATFSGRGTDVDVVLDLMIHDIDLVLRFVGRPVTSAIGYGRCPTTSSLDSASARIEFEGGCIADLTASRRSPFPTRAMRLVGKDRCLSLDFLGRALTVAARAGDQQDEGENSLVLDRQTFGATDALLDETHAFVQAVRAGVPPAVSGAEGLRALEVALAITQTMGWAPIHTKERPSGEHWS